MSLPLSQEEQSSWFESRRLIISQLNNMDGAIRELSTKMDRYNDLGRDRTTEVSKENQVAINDLRVRIAMLEVRAQIWGGIVGMIAGAVTSILVELIWRVGTH